MKTETLTRRAVFGVAGGVAAACILTAARAEAPARIVVHRSAACGCCGAWSERLRGTGFSVEVIDEADMKAVKARLGVPSALASCHTAEAGGYVIEGHVPVSAIQRLLTEKPKAIGLAVPGMPSGSPGMEAGGEKDVYDVLLFDGAGQRSYGKFEGDRAL